MRLQSTGIIVIALAVTLACQHSENRYLKRSVAPNEIVGTWMATPFAIESLRYAGHTTHLAQSDHVIVIRSDGTCFFQSFTDPSASQGADKTFVASECDWKLDNDGHQAIRLRLKNPVADNPYFYFDEENDKLLLWQFVDDPDAWKYVEFVKQTNGPR